MCCIFTYLTWTIDFIQRLWTFLMTCCIGCTVFVLLFVAALAGICFGYNYSVSEYYRIEGSQKYVIMSRDLQSNKTVYATHLNDTKGKIKDTDYTLLSKPGNFNGIIGNDIPYYRSFDYKDENKYVNSLSSPDTWDLEMDEIINNYPSGSVDQMKAILNHINSRKSKKYYNKTTRISATSTQEISTSKTTVANNVTKLKIIRTMKINTQSGDPFKKHQRL